MTKRFGALILATSLLVSCSAQGAAVGGVTPLTFASAVRDAKAGDTITLSPGNYGDVTIRQRQWSRPVTIRGNGAVFSGIVMQNVDGLAIDGGTVVGRDQNKLKAVLVIGSRNVALANMNIKTAVVGIVIRQSEKISVRNTTISDMSADGFHIVASHFVTLDGNSCRAFTPLKRIFENGQLVKDERHPDCIQGWSLPGEAPLSDVTITNNTINGDMQGISFFNHSRNGVDDGGFDRVTIANNTVVTTRPRGIALLGGRNSSVRDNNVSSIPGSVLARNGNLVRTGVEVTGTANTACNNVARDKPDSPEARRCAR